MPTVFLSDFRKDLQPTKKIVKHQLFRKKWYCAVHEVEYLGGSILVVYSEVG